MKVSKKAINLLGVALVYTVTSSFIALLPEDIISTRSYFSAAGKVNAAISTLKSEDIIKIDAENFDINKWIQTGATNIFIINARDDGKPVVVYFEVTGNICDLIGGINPMVIYPDEKGEELVMPIRNISLFEIRDNTYSGTIKVRAFNDYINDLVIEIPDVKGNEILAIRENQWPYGGNNVVLMSLISMSGNDATLIDILSKYDINTYEDMAAFIRNFEIFEEQHNELQRAYDALLVEKENLLLEKEELTKSNEALSIEIEKLQEEIDKVKDEKDELIQSYNSLYEEAERLRNHSCPSPSSVGSSSTNKPSVPANPRPAEPTPTEPGTDEPEPTNPEPTDPEPAEPEPAEPDNELTEPQEPEEREQPASESDDTASKPDEVDVIDNNRDEDDGNEGIVDDSGYDNSSQEEPSIVENVVSGPIKDMVNKLKRYI